MGSEIGDKLLGKEFETKKCGKCFIIDYKNCNNVLVAFYNPFCIVKCRLSSLQKCHVSNPMFPTFLGKGYIGVGKYTSKNCGRIYKLWTGVLRRCLGTSYLHYKDVLYKHSCGTKGLGKLVVIGGEVRALDSRGELKPSYGYDITAWCEIPD